MILCNSVETAGDGGELGEGRRLETGKDGSKDFVRKRRHANASGHLSFLSSGEIAVNTGVGMGDQPGPPQQ